MQFRILNQPAASALELQLNNGERIHDRVRRNDLHDIGIYLETTTHTRGGVASSKV